MAEEWNVGDQALCVNTKELRPNGWISTGKGLVMFKLYNVVGLEWDEAKKALLLHLADDPTGDLGRLAVRFKKIPPSQLKEELEKEKELEDV